MPTKAAVIDDAGYLLTNTFMRGHSAPKSGSSSFDLYNDIADSFWDLLRFIQNDLPEDVIVYIIMGDRHFFRTQSSGMDISKSPEEMFDLEIENDLKAVDTRIREYWGLSPLTGGTPDA